ncbi:MAG TPA: hypothetical protein VE869_16100 [Gemmatimonas sp.]|nr:hypothetical protein [Gemmatimonas sp.]
MSDGSGERPIELSGERFVNELRSRDEAIRLASPNAPGVWTVRVQGAEVWDAVRVTAMPTAPVREVKAAAMAALMPDVELIDAYVVKLRGIEVTNETASLEACGALDGSTLLVMSRRRRPVR